VLNLLRHWLRGFMCTAEADAAVAPALPMPGARRQEHAADPTRRRIAVLVSGLMLCLVLAVLQAPLAHPEVVVEAQSGTVSKALLEEAELARAEERVAGIRAELALQQPGAATRVSGATPPRKTTRALRHARQPDEEQTELEKKIYKRARALGTQLRAKIRELRDNARSAVQHVIRDKRAEAQIKAELLRSGAVPGEKLIDRELPAVQRPARGTVGTRIPEIVVVDEAPLPSYIHRNRNAEDSAEANTIREWRAQQSEAWEDQKLKKAVVTSSLARMEKQDQPEIMKWKKQQTAAWDDEKISLAQKAKASERKIDQELKREKRQIRLWRDQQQTATRKWREYDSEKVEDERVRQARLKDRAIEARRSGHGHEQRVKMQEHAAKHEIKSITAKEMQQWNSARKGDALARIHARVRGLNPTARKETEEHGLRAQGVGELKRRQAKVQDDEEWKKLVKMAIGEPANARLHERERSLTDQAKRHPDMDQNLDAFLRWSCDGKGQTCVQRVRLWNMCIHERACNACDYKPCTFITPSREQGQPRHVYTSTRCCRSLTE
jgi:hypothetical protein